MTIGGSTSSTNSGGSLSLECAAKPPTPPLHRFPSWESRIYQVAADGLQVVPVGTQTSTADTANNNSLKQPSGACSVQGYCDISVPVYATVKGVRIYPLLPEGMCFIYTKTYMYVCNLQYCVLFIVGLSGEVTHIIACSSHTSLSKPRNRFYLKFKCEFYFDLHFCVVTFCIKIKLYFIKFCKKWVHDEQCVILL